jgi:hypothetical protein
LAPVGFSWTNFFFGFFVPLLRKDWVGAVVQFVLASVTMGISNLIFPFIYNKMYIKSLISDGFVVAHSSIDLQHVSNDLKLALPASEEE